MLVLGQNLGTSSIDANANQIIPSLERIDGTIEMQNLMPKWVKAPSSGKWSLKDEEIKDYLALFTTSPKSETLSYPLIFERAFGHSLENYHINDYRELFKGKDEFILCFGVQIATYQPHQDPRPSFLPAEYFFDKKRFDNIELPCIEQKKKYVLRCDESRNRFEECVKGSFNKACKELEDKIKRTPDEEKQWQIIQGMKTKYYPFS